MMKALFIGVTASFLLASSAVAQSRFPCAEDIKKACSDVDPGRGRIVACIKEHLKDFSDGCKERLSTISASTKVCRDDIEKACGSVKSRARKVVCVMDALTDLSDACQDSIADAIARARR